MNCDDGKQSATNMDTVWSGNSTFRPMRHAEDDGMDRQAASGLYGFTKGIQGSVEAGVRKLSRHASKTAAALWAKDPKSAEFLATHSRKADSLPAKILLSAMSELGPKVDKVAAGRTHGLYGFRNKTAKNALVACQGLREEAGFIAHELATRKADKYADLVGYMEKHCDATQCPYTSLLMQAMPEDRVALVRTAQDSGAGSAAHIFFDNPRKRVVREFAWTKALTNVPTVGQQAIKDFDTLDKSPSKLKSEINKTPDTPTETIKSTPGSDQFSTLSKYVVFTEQPVKKMPNKVPEGHGDVKKAPELSIVHDLVTEKFLAKQAARLKGKG